MDFFMAHELSKARSSLSGLSARVSAFSSRAARLSGFERLRAIETLARMADEAHVSGPLSSVLRNDSGLRSKCSQINRAIEEKLVGLVEGVDDEAGLRRVFQSLRGRFPRLARDVEMKASKLRSTRVVDKPQVDPSSEVE